MMLMEGEKVLDVGGAFHQFFHHWIVAQGFATGHLWCTQMWGMHKLEETRSPLVELMSRVVAKQFLGKCSKQKMYFYIEHQAHHSVCFKSAKPSWLGNMSWMFLEWMDDG